MSGVLKQLRCISPKDQIYGFKPQNMLGHNLVHPNDWVYECILNMERTAVEYMSPLKCKHQGSRKKLKLIKTITKQVTPNPPEKNRK